MSLTPDQVYLAKFLLEQKHSPEVVAGMLGNVAIETGDGANPNAFNPRENAKGIVQWTPAGGRQAAVDEYMRTLEGVEPWSLPAQAHALQWELDNGEKNAALALSGATTPAEAASIFDAKFERSSGEHRGRRQAAANDIYKAMGEMDLANVDLAKLAITDNQPWPTNPMANDAMSANPPSGPTTFSLNSIMAPQENEKSAFHPTLGLQGLGAAIAAGSMGESAADDLANLRKQYFGERETEAERQRQEQQRAAMGPIFQKHPDLYAAWQAGAPAEQLLGIATARENMQWQTGERVGSQDFTAGQNSLDRGLKQYLTEEQMAQDKVLAEEGFQIDWARHDETVKENSRTYDRWYKDHSFDRERAVEEDKRWQSQFGFETDKYNRELQTGQDQGVAAQTLFVETAKRLGATDLADKYSAMPPTAFQDPAMVGQMQDILSKAYVTPEDRTDKMREFDHYLELSTSDPAAAAVYARTILDDPMAPGADRDKLTAKQQEFEEWRALVDAGDPTADQYRKYVLGDDPAKPSGNALDAAKYSKARDAHAEALKTRASAAETRRSAETMLMMIQSGQVDTGKIDAALQPAFEILVDAGLVDSDGTFAEGVNSKRVFEAMANKVFPTLRQIGSGSTSDWEGTVMQTAFASLGTSPEANEQLLQAFVSQGMREEAYLREMDKWISEKGSIDGFNADFAHRMDVADPSVGRPTAFDITTLGSTEEGRKNLAAHVKAGNINVGDKLYMKNDKGKYEVTIADEQDLVDILRGNI